MQSLDDAYSIFFNAEGNATIYTTHPSNMLVHSVHRESISNHVKPKIYIHRYHIYGQNYFSNIGYYNVSLNVQSNTFDCMVRKGWFGQPTKLQLNLKAGIYIVRSRLSWCDMLLPIRRGSLQIEQSRCSPSPGRGSRQRLKLLSASPSPS